MKTAIKVFEILAIIAAVFTGILLVFVLVGIATGSNQIIDALINQNGGSSLDEASRNAIITTITVYYSFILVWEIVRIVIAVLSLKKVKNPISKKPVALGVVNIFFGSLIGGILLLCLKPENN